MLACKITGASVVDGTGAPRRRAGGYYRDKMRRTDEGWRVTERIQETAWFGHSAGTPQPRPGARPQ